MMFVKRNIRGDIVKIVRRKKNPFLDFIDVKDRLGANLCSEGPMFRGAYVPHFCEKCSEQRTLGT